MKVALLPEMTLVANGDFGLRGAALAGAAEIEVLEEQATAAGAIGSIAGEEAFTDGDAADIVGSGDDRSTGAPVSATSLDGGGGDGDGAV